MAMGATERKESEMKKRCGETRPGKMKFLKKDGKEKWE